jgi:hypothetical protein
MVTLDSGGAGGRKKQASQFVNVKKKKDDGKEEKILDESFEIDVAMLNAKNPQKKKVKPLYQGVECEVSWYLFSKKNFLRTIAYKLSQLHAFENTVLVLIILSSLKLVYDTYIMFTLSPEDSRMIMSNNIDYFFTVFFALESATKALALGFFMDDGSYLRESWNQLDFFIVLTSIIDASFENINLPIIKVWNPDDRIDSETVENIKTPKIYFT